MIKYKNPFLCPKCQNKGKWRHGYQYENEMICFKCWESWSPSEIDEENRENARNLQNQYGDGI